MTYIVSDGAAQLVHSWSSFSNFLGSTDDIRCILQWPFPPEEKTVERSVTVSDLLQPCSICRTSISVMVWLFGFFLVRGKYGLESVTSGEYSWKHHRNTHVCWCIDDPIYTHWYHIVKSELAKFCNPLNVEGHFSRSGLCIKKWDRDTV